VDTLCGFWCVGQSTSRFNSTSMLKIKGRSNFLRDFKKIVREAKNCNIWKSRHLNFNEMKKIILISTVILLSLTVDAQTGSDYLDLSKDQLKKGGLTAKDISGYLSKGYKLLTLDKDTSVKLEFLSANGKKYFKVGLLKAGTQYLGTGKKTEKFIVTGCGNWGGYSKPV
jgi:hypothetical protein